MTSTATNQHTSKELCNEVYVSGSRSYNQSEIIDILVSDYPTERYSTGHNSDTNTSASSQNKFGSAHQVNSAQSINDLVTAYSRRSPGVRKLNSRSFSPISEWEGYVEKIEGDNFYAKLVNIRSSSGFAEDEGLFSIMDLSEFQRPELEEGSMIRWVIGYQRLPGGQRQNVSELYIRKVPMHSKREIDAALNAADELLSGLNVED